MADNSAKVYLIKLVRVRKVLYSKAHQDFKDSRTVECNNWDDVAKEMANTPFTRANLKWAGPVMMSSALFGLVKMATVNGTGPTTTGLVHLALALALHIEPGRPAQLWLAQLWLAQL